MALIFSRCCRKLVSFKSGILNENAEGTIFLNYFFKQSKKITTPTNCAELFSLQILLGEGGGAAIADAVARVSKRSDLKNPFFGVFATFYPYSWVEWFRECLRTGVSVSG